MTRDMSTLLLMVSPIIVLPTHVPAALSSMASEKIIDNSNSNRSDNLAIAWTPKTKSLFVLEFA